MVREVVLGLSAVAVLLSLIWFVTMPSFEPLVTLIVGIIGLFSSLPEKDKSLSAALPGSDNKPILETFESEFWPEEGVPVFRAVSSLLTLHVRPSHDAPISAEMSIETGSNISFTAFRYRTVRPGKVVAKSHGVLTGRNLGQIGFLSREAYYDIYSEPLEFPFEEGDTFEYLQYRAEGSCFVRRDGYVLNIDYCPWLGSSELLTLTKQPEAESWIHVVDESGRAKGWLLAETGIVEETERQF